MDLREFRLEISTMSTRSRFLKIPFFLSLLCESIVFQYLYFVDRGNTCLHHFLCMFLVTHSSRWMRETVIATGSVRECFPRLVSNLGDSRRPR